MAIFGRKPQVNLFGKMSIFRIFELLVLKAQKSPFFVPEYRKRHFLGLYCLKKRLEKQPFLDQNHGVNPFGKMSILGLFEVPVFIAQKGVFSFYNIIKDIFRTYIVVKKKLEKWQFSVQNHGLTPLEKCQFFDFLKFLFLQLRKAFFRSTIS